VKVVKFSAALLIGLFMMLAVASQVATAQSSVAQMAKCSTAPQTGSGLI
jgi:hypothetical protein